MEERWVLIKGFGDKYFISDFGNVKSDGGFIKLRDGSKIKRALRILKPSITNWGYQRVVLQDNGYRKHVKVHRLVAEAFVVNYDNKEQVNHIDGNKLNNHYSNLEWCSNIENQQHAFKTGLKQFNEKGRFMKINNK